VTREGCFPKLKKTRVAKFVGGDSMCLKLGVKRVVHVHLHKIISKVCKIIVSIIVIRCAQRFFQ
jgi:hypothetical protein